MLTLLLKCWHCLVSFCDASLGQSKTPQRWKELQPQESNSLTAGLEKGNARAIDVNNCNTTHVITPHHDFFVQTTTVPRVLWYLYKCVGRWSSKSKWISWCYSCWIHRRCVWACLIAIILSQAIQCISCSIRIANKAWSFFVCDRNGLMFVITAFVVFWRIAYGSKTKSPLVPQSFRSSDGLVSIRFSLAVEEHKPTSWGVLDFFFWFLSVMHHWRYQNKRPWQAVNSTWICTVLKI